MSSNLLSNFIQCPRVSQSEGKTQRLQIAPDRPKKEKVGRQMASAWLPVDGSIGGCCGQGTQVTQALVVTLEAFIDAKADAWCEHVNTTVINAYSYIYIYKCVYIYIYL